MVPIATTNRARQRRAWAVGASALALWAAPAVAQDETATETEENGEPVITVTGSRLATTGMDTPVPVTAVQAD
ncbi:MAG TPA: hypothetical protein VFS49_06870, partial [Croceibacterium sp.]|nr:hypothetical protein [Croceibacterium sp.]